jgi:hypothetical protein
MVLDDATSFFRPTGGAGDPSRLTARLTVRLAWRLAARLAARLALAEARRLASAAARPDGLLRNDLAS